MTNPVVVMKGDFTGVSGYARCTRAYAKALFESGMNLFCQDHRKDDTGQRDDFWQKMLTERSVDASFKCDIKIWHESPHFWEPTDQCMNVGYFTFESTGIPDKDLNGDPRNNWVNQCNKMDLILVPCTFNKRCFEKNGVTTPIRVIPHIVYPPKPQSEPFFQETPGHLRALSIMQWTMRKDPISLIIGFYRANIPASRLLIKTYGLAFDEKNLVIIDRIQRIKKSFYETPVGIISPILERFTDEQIDRLYVSADVYITTSKGEGFALPATEAGAAGIPIIAPTGTAFEDYMSEEIGYSLEWDWEPVNGMDHLPFGVWYSPSTDWMRVKHPSVEKALLQARKDMDTPCDYRGEKTTVLKYKGQKAKETIEALCSEAIVVKKYTEAMMEIYHAR